MSNGKVTIHDVFDITSRIEMKMDKLGERVSLLEVWKAGLEAKLAIFASVLSFSIYTSIDWIKKKLTGG